MTFVAGFGVRGVSALGRGAAEGVDAARGGASVGSRFRAAAPPIAKGAAKSAGEIGTGLLRSAGNRTRTAPVTGLVTGLSGGGVRNVGKDVVLSLLPIVGTFESGKLTVEICQNVGAR